MKKFFGLLSVFLVAVMLLAACAPAATPAPQPTEAQSEPTAMPEPTQVPKTIVDIAVADGRFTTLVAAVQAAGLAETLTGEGPFTVFAPTDDAFAKLPTGTIDALLADIPQLTSILTYHVVSGKVMAADVLGLDGQMVKTVNGQEIAIKVENGNVYINDSMVIITDIEASNGVIHVIDTVLLPKKDTIDTAIADGRFTTLVAAVQAAGLVETLKGEGPFTVFAPTDDAFAKLPAGTIDALLADIPQLSSILTYHVVSGKVMAADVLGLNGQMVKTVNGQELEVKVDMGKVYINDAEVIITDIVTSNGVIHVIDTVLLPKKDIVDTAIADGRFTTLVAAIQAASLAETLKGEGPFTVFAPTDDAFAKLPPGTIEALLADIPQLTAILTYHVVPGKVMAADVLKLDGQMVKTVQGSEITIKVQDGKVFVNDAEVIITDIVTSNGVIHVIDTVILPPQ